MKITVIQIAFFVVIEVDTMGKRNGFGAFGVEPTSGNQV